MKSLFTDFQFETKGEKALRDASVIHAHTQEQDIAVIGLALNLPSAATPEEFWRICTDGVDLIGDVPLSRKNDIEDYLRFKGKGSEAITYLKGAFLDTIDRFDHKFFRLSPKEASLMHPCQRLFLEKAWEAIENAGYGGEKLVGSKTGVFVGYIGDIEGYKYRQMVSDAEGGFNPIAATGNLPSLIPSRISYLLDLKGPSMLIDTACSSSLVAVSLACESLRSGKCDMALAGGVKIYLLPLQTDEVLGIESPQGKTRAFDDSADGTGIGEGIGVVVLKPLKNAVRDRDHIYAVIKGSAINQDGSSASITAPSAFAQTEVITSAWIDARIDPETVSYIEAHGTGTKLGDPIEIDGMKRAFEHFTHKKQFCAIGSVKTNLGHLYEAAGIIGMIKTVLALKYKQLPPSLHFQMPNQTISFEESSIYLNNRLLTWTKERHPRRAGVSAFGISGTNCHLILEEAPEEKTYPERQTHTYSILTISAKTRGALDTLLESYRQFLARGGNWTESDICFTASTGRGHYTYRLAIIVRDMADLQKKLDQLRQTDDYRDGAQDIFYNECSPLVSERGEHDYHHLFLPLRDERAAQTEKAYQSCLTLCELYIKGHCIPWELLYLGKEVKRVVLPSYPFDTYRCWVNVPQGSRDEKKEQSHTILASPKVALAGRVGAQQYSALEREVGQIWGEVLGFDTINIHESFYQLGGDSISMTRVANRLNATPGRTIEIRVLFEHDSIEKIARFLQAHALLATDEESFGIPNRDRQPLLAKGVEQSQYEASSAQKRIYMLQQFDPTSTVYNVTGAIEIGGEIDIQRIEDAFNRLIRRHEILRTVFELKDGILIQRVLEPESLLLKIERKALEDEQMVADYLESFIQPFDLSQLPLIRLALIHLGETRKILVLDIHHSIADVTSLAILTRELSEIYAGEQLAPPQFQYKDFAAWQERRKASAEYKTHEQYWLREFDGEIPLLNLPTDCVRPPVKDFKGGSVSFTLDSEATTSLKELAVETGNTVYIVLLATIKVLLSKYASQKDLVIGSPIAGRNHEDLEKIVGIMINTIAIRSTLPGEASFREYLQQLREKVLQAYNHQEYQFEELIEKLGLERRPGRNPLCDVFFSLQSVPTLEIEGIKFTEYPLPRNTEMFDLSFVAAYEKGAITFRVTYARSLFTEQSIHKMIERYKNIIRSINSAKDIALKDIRFVTDEEAATYARLTEDRDLIDAEFCF